MGQIREENLATKVLEALKEQQPSTTQIGENEYFEIMTNQAQIHYTNYRRICESLAEVESKISRGLIVKYYTDGQHMWYEVHEKQPAGFNPCHQEAVENTTL